MSVGLRLMGGLGNMCFQIATGETWRQRGFDVVYTNMDENLEYIGKNYTPKRNSEVYKSLFPNFTWDDHKAPSNAKFRQQHVPFVYTEINPEEGVEYIGYFQSEKNFPDREFIRYLFRPSEEIRDAIFEFNLRFISPITCSIHVRRQDYLKLAHFHTNLTMDYYKRAMQKLLPRSDYKFLVFSDDLEWCTQNFRGNKFRFIDVNEYTALFLMASCNHNIIANSSLSWFSAYLGETPDKTIVAPVEWFPNDKQDSKDIIPSRWVRI